MPRILPFTACTARWCLAPLMRPRESWIGASRGTERRNNLIIMRKNWIGFTLCGNNTGGVKMSKNIAGHQVCVNRACFVVKHENQHAVIIMYALSLETDWPSPETVSFYGRVSPPVWDQRMPKGDPYKGNPNTFLRSGQVGTWVDSAFVHDR